MTKLFSSQDLTEVEFFESLLQDHGIASTVRNQFLSATRGEVPFTDTWPEIWLLRDSDLPQAQAILEAGQFTTCWNFGSARSA